MRPGAPKALVRVPVLPRRGRFGVDIFEGGQGGCYTPRACFMVTPMSAGEGAM